MILLFAITLTAQALRGEGGDIIPRPRPFAHVAGECERVLPLEKGRPLPGVFGIIPSSSPCSGVVVPLSDYSDLLATESWGKAVSERYTIDITALEADRDWYKAKLQEANKPLPFLERPGTQRWLGRIETLVTVGVVTVGLGTAYHYSSGGFR